MDAQQLELETLQQHPDFIRLANGRARLGWSLTVVMLAIYFGFILLLAFAPATLGTPLGGGVMTLGIPIGVGIIVAAIVLTAVYVRRANTELDPINERLRKECQA
ncbi:DUF485 domain-containing protein [Cupriavidus pinatubonensis]|uniref:Inner membrane protein YjcH n=1 Tax=Cupriavidus pinatubonensis TaxID=248026 RepID=A0ABN7YKR2_9BURK|nr:DUF485 domain-containing protein [Cupriavidus pinatubonensis]CAG9172981.1 Inner membrane protein YjcH [Cupriavidus pinatubonensis]